MTIQIDPRKVRGVVVAADAVLQGKFNYGETLVGLAELIGRIIVEKATSPIQAKELIDIVGNHVVNTVSVGADAKGKSLIERV